MPSGRFIFDVEFARRGTAPVFLDVYLPMEVTNKSLPVIVWLYGGGWRMGSRKAPPLLPLEYGYAVVALDYRLSGVAAWPAQLDDCQDAIRCVRARGKEWGLDTERIGVWGKSAGGHLAAMLAVLTGTQRGEKDKAWHVQAVANYCGPSDLLQYTQPGQRTRYAAMLEVTEQLLHGRLEDRLEQARHASPVTHVSEKCAPLLIVHGDADPTVPPADAPLLYEKLKALGADVTLRMVPGAGHNCSSLAVDTETMKFFKRVLG